MQKVDLAWPASCDCEALRAEIAELRALIEDLLQQAYEFGREDERKGTYKGRTKLRLLKGGLATLAATAGLAGVAFSGTLLPHLYDRTPADPPGSHARATVSQLVQL